MKKIYFLLTLLAITLCWSCSGGSDTTDGDEFLIVMPTELSFEAEGGQQQVDVSSSSDWTTNTVASWISIKRNKNSMTLTVEANTTSEERTGTVSVNNGNSTQTVTVHQSAGKTREIEYELADNTSIVDVKGITSANSEEKTIVFPSFEASKYSLKEDCKIILNEPSEFFPDGLIARVTSVEESSEGVTVTYEKIPLQEAFETLRMDEIPLDLATNVTKIVDADGKELPYTRTRAADMHTLHFDLPEVGWPFILGFEITPKMSIDVALKLQAIVEKATFYTFNAVTDMQVKLGADISAGLDLFEVGKHFHLLTIYFGAIPAGPLLVTPAMDLNAVLSASGKVSFEISSSVTVGVSAGLHYDINDGWRMASTPGKNFAKGEVSIGPKLEGSIGYGLGTDLRIGLYGDIVSASIACDFMRKETVSEKLDLVSMGIKEFFDQKLVEHLQNMELDVSNYVKASAFISAVGMDSPSLDGPEVKFPGETYKLLPTASKDLTTVVQEREDGDSIMNVSMSGWIKNKYAIPSDKFVVRAVEKYALDRDKAEDEAIMAEIDTDVSGLFEEDEDSVSFSVEMELPGMHVYEMQILMVDGDWGFRIGKFDVPVMRPETDDEQCLRAILNDILKSRVGRWDGCDWDNDLEHIDRLSYLKREKGADGKMKNIITIPKEWKLSESLHIGDHTSGSKEFGSWILNIDEAPESELRTVTVEDPSCGGLSLDSKVENLTVHSPLYTLAALPKAAKKVDLSGTGLTTFSCCGGDNVCTPTSVNLENCKELREVTFGISGTKQNKLPQYSVAGCEKLEKINMWNLALEGADFLKASIGTSTTKLLIKECQIGVVTFPDTFSEIVVQESKFNILTLVSNKSVTKFDIQKSTGESINVNDCPALHTLRCPNTGISSFSIANVPAITLLDCSKNTSLRSVVPDVFDQMKANPEAALSYDIRYEYPTGGEPIDHGYGFWYEGEPKSKQHAPKENPSEDDPPIISDDSLVGNWFFNEMFYGTNIIETNCLIFNEDGTYMEVEYQGICDDEAPKFTYNCRGYKVVNEGTYTVQGNVLTLNSTMSADGISFSVYKDKTFNIYKSEINSHYARGKDYTVNTYEMVLEGESSGSLRPHFFKEIWQAEKVRMKVPELEKIDFSLTCKSQYHTLLSTKDAWGLSNREYDDEETMTESQNFEAENIKMTENSGGYHVEITKNYQKESWLYPYPQVNYQYKLSFDINQEDDNNVGLVINNLKFQKDTNWEQDQSWEKTSMICESSRIILGENRDYPYSNKYLNFSASNKTNVPFTWESSEKKHEEYLSGGYMTTTKTYTLKDEKNFSLYINLTGK